MAKTPRKLPDLSNATPTFLIDEIGKLRDRMKDDKFMEGVYRKALDARIADGQTSVEGDIYIGSYTTATTERLDLDLVRSTLTPEQLKACTVVNDVVTLRVPKKEG